MSWPMCYDHVFRKLRGVYWSKGGNWGAFCPAHPDKRQQSLSLKIGRRGNLIMRCHAGHRCTARDIVSALGLTFEDLFEDNRYYNGKPEKRSMTTKQRDQIVCTYAYRDEERQVLYEVVRLMRANGERGWAQRRDNPDFDPGQSPGTNNQTWVWNLNGVRFVPYCLPELLEDLRANARAPVFIAEGEKDVDGLRAIGCIATCNPCGALKWHLIADMMRPILAGRNVCVLADDDPVDKKNGYRPGVRHAWQVATALQGAAARIKVFRPYRVGKKQDISDWLAERSGAPEALRQELYGAVSGLDEWKGELLPGAEAGSEELTDEQRDPFGCRVREELARMRAKSRAPIRSSAEALGAVSMHLSALQAAALQGGGGRSDEQFLQRLAQMAAAALMAGGDLS